MSSDARRAIGLDVGGTKIAAGIVDEHGRLLSELVEPTPAPSLAESVTPVLLDLVARLRKEDPEVEAVGLGAAGLVRWPEGRVVWAPNNAYRDWPVRAELAAATGLSVAVDNDANVATLAESRLGARPYRDMVLLALGTGIGGGILLGGELYRGPTGMGTELGHIVVDPDGPPCACGGHGCLEAFASGSALGRMGREAAAADPDGLIARLGRSTGVTGPTVTAAAVRGDAVARGLFDRLGRWLGVGIASLATIFELEAVVVGGGLSETGELLLAPTRAAVAEFTYAREARGVVPVLAASCGGDAGMIGAALLALKARGSMG
ncbi:MAG: ROK family protein [Pseudonocardia sp.]